MRSNLHPVFIFRHLDKLTVKITLPAREENLMTLLYCILAAVNGYCAVTFWPQPIAILNAAIGLYMAICAVKTIKSQ